MDFRCLAQHVALALKKVGNGLFLFTLWSKQIANCFFFIVVTSLDYIYWTYSSIALDFFKVSTPSSFYIADCASPCMSSSSPSLRRQSSVVRWYWHRPPNGWSTRIALPENAIMKCLVRNTNMGIAPHLLEPSRWRMELLAQKGKLLPSFL